MSETLPGHDKCAAGFLHLVRLVARSLSVFHLRYLHVLSHLVKLLLGLLKLAYIPAWLKARIVREMNRVIMEIKQEKGGKNSHLLLDKSVQLLFNGSLGLVK